MQVMDLVKYKVIIWDRHFVPGRDPDNIHHLGGPAIKIKGRIIETPANSAEFLLISIYGKKGDPNWSWQTTGGALNLSSGFDWVARLPWGKQGDWRADQRSFMIGKYGGDPRINVMNGPAIFQTAKDLPIYTDDTNELTPTRFISDCCFLRVDENLTILLLDAFQLLCVRGAHVPDPGEQPFQHATIRPANVLLRKWPVYHHYNILGWRIVAVPSDFDPNDISDWAPVDKLVYAALLLLQKDLLAKAQQDQFADLFFANLEAFIKWTAILAAIAFFFGNLVALGVGLYMAVSGGKELAEDVCNELGAYAAIAAEAATRKPELEEAAKHLANAIVKMEAIGLVTLIALLFHEPLQRGMARVSEGGKVARGALADRVRVAGARLQEAAPQIQATVGAALSGLGKEVRDFLENQRRQRQGRRAARQPQRDENNRERTERTRQQRVVSRRKWLSTLNSEQLAKLSSNGDKDATYVYNERRQAALNQEAQAIANKEVVTPADQARIADLVSSARGYRAENSVIDELGDQVVSAGEDIHGTSPRSGEHQLLTDIDVETTTEVIQVKAGRDLPSDSQAEATALYAQSVGKRPVLYYNQNLVGRGAVQRFIDHGWDVRPRDF